MACESGPSRRVQDSFAARTRGGWVARSSRAMTTCYLFDAFDGGGVGDFHFGAVVELEPAANTDALAGELAHIEACLAEQLHVLWRHRDGKILAVIGATIDVGASLVERRRCHRTIDDLECSDAIVELFGCAQVEQTIAPMAAPLGERFALGGDEFPGAERAGAV